MSLLPGMLLLSLRKAVDPVGHQLSSAPGTWASGRALERQRHLVEERGSGVRPPSVDYPLSLSGFGASVLLALKWVYYPSLTHF